jgi:UDP-glucose 4-epimerase
LSDKVLITGGAGFIGSHLARGLLALGKTVYVIDDLSTGLYANVEEIDHRPHFHLFVDTIRNVQLMDRLLRQCHTVYHLASAVGVRLIMERPVYTIDNIYQGTEVILRLARRYRNRVLITSTSEVYGKSGLVPLVEDGDRLEGSTCKHRWAYACAKALDEFLALAHWKETRLPVVITRLFNTAGPRQRGHYGMVLPTFVEAALRGDDLLVHGDGSQSRCFCHVEDAVRAVIALMEADDCYGQVYNVGSTAEISIRELAETVVRRLDSRSHIRFVPYGEVYGEGFEDMQRRVPSLAKIERAIGWQPKKSLHDIIDDLARHLSAVPKAHGPAGV